MKRVVWAAILALAAGGAESAAAETPRFFDPGARMPPASTEQIQSLRFVTTGDFAPFNAIGPTGNPIGYNVDLAREVCRELNLLERCFIRALPMAEARAAVRNGEADALIAGLSVTAQTREDFSFSLPYLPLPARFVVRQSTGGDGSRDGKRIAVMAGSAHQRMLRDYFPAARTITYSREEWMLDALAKSEVDAVFGDGMRLSLWLSGGSGRECCRFSGGPYLAPEYLGFGLAIAFNKDAEGLTGAADQALRELERKGVTGELYLRYFPVSFF